MNPCFFDTANNYAFWVNLTQGGESEALLGRWRRSRGVRDEIVIATKLGGRPVAPGLGFAETAHRHNVEGLPAKVIRESAERSREALGVDRLDLLYAHLEDPTVPLTETVEAFAELVAEGTVGLLGASNHWAWRLDRARSLAAAAGLPGYEVLQYHHSYLRPRTDLPGRRSRVGNQGFVSGDLLSYLLEEPGLAVLRDVAKQAGATVNQVVLAWLIGGEVPVIPLVGASSVAQLDESLAAVDLELTPEQRAGLDAAR